MCRFVAYIGHRSIVLSDILEKPSNSLIHQSRHALKLKPPLNADGFGIAWYQKEIDKSPGLFKSTQPAWNDLNLKHIASRITSKCFIGHVRASTVGNVSTSNCHPFAYKKYAFCHNGHISNFDKIKRELRKSICDELYQQIIGQTDSEHFFSLLMNDYFKNKPSKFANLLQSYKKSTQMIIDLLQKTNIKPEAHLNTVITDGEQLIATRITTDNKNVPSLYYSTEAYPGAVIIASEPLGKRSRKWLEIPINQAIAIDKDLQLSLHDLSK